MTKTAATLAENCVTVSRSPRVPSASIDPVTHEIIQGKLLSVVDEMAIVMTKTSMSPVIYEVLDFACGICNAQGELIAQTNGITLFTGTSHIGSTSAAPFLEASLPMRPRSFKKACGCPA